jgi:histidinol dehydrogenase
MFKIITYPSGEAERKLTEIASRQSGSDPLLEKKVYEILQEVRRDGDKALIRYTRTFDAPEMEESDLTVPRSEIENVYAGIDPNFLRILKEAAANIESFHRHQMRSSQFFTKPDGTFLGQIVRPVSAAGLYVPGGKEGETPLISSVLMNSIPARLAGVKDIALATPPRRDGSVNPYLLAAAWEAGVTRVHKVGSAWAVAALAYGTASIPKVDVVVGPGNIYVATAKKLLSGMVGIDLLAGPSEILVIADQHANPEYIAADLLSQAEHDSMASAILITTEKSLAKHVGEFLNKQLVALPRREIARGSLDRYGAAFLVEDLNAAVALANRLAPEHLELQVLDPWALLGRIEHAGAVFLGNYSPEAVGDYFAGPNHVLPTAGTARFASALGVENFLKKTSVISYSKEALNRDGAGIMRLAELEGLQAHAASVRVRLENDTVG